jgi:hypothetical protein
MGDISKGASMNGLPLAKYRKVSVNSNKLLVRQ